MAGRTGTGKCYLCGGTFSKGGMSRHLQACRQANPQPLGGTGQERTTRLFHLALQGHDSPEYWLHLEVPADARLADLDRFLRDIWLECCGHLSAFTVGEDQYITPAEPGEKSMRVALGRALDVGTVFSHEYDFGSTTELSLKVMAEREGAARGKSIQVLARNDPPPIVCGNCGKTATQVCTECNWSGEGWLCGACAAEHQCGEELLLPVVNSPRVGVCAYVGRSLLGGS